MSRLLITTDDRLFLDKRYWRLAMTTAAGYVFTAADDPSVTMSLTRDELAERLRERTTTFERGYFDPGKSRARLDAPTDCLRDLPRAIRRLVLWKVDYCAAFFALESQSRVKRTEESITAAMGSIRHEVDVLDLARQHGERKLRAGRKTYVRKPPCPRSLLQWLRTYERAGRDPLALIPGTHRSGNTVSRFCAEGARLIATGIAKYATIQQPSKGEVAEDCVSDFKELNRKRGLQGLPAITVPSRRCVERKIGKLDPYTTHAKRYGTAAANMKFAAIELGIKAGYPMERIEIDEWNVDILTLLTEIGALDAMSEEQRAGLVTERLWLYVAIDCATRCILALRLAASPNAQDAVLTLADATRDKSDLSRSAGCEAAWTQHGGFGAVVTDNGTPLVSDVFQTAVTDLGGHPERPPTGIARLRGLIERLFRSFGTELMTKLSGRTFSNPIERGDYPSEDLAAHSRETLLQILTLYVVDIYHYKPHAGLGGETPADCWKRLETMRSTIPPPVPQVRCRVFGIELLRTVSRKGVTVLGNDYACQELRDMLRHSHETQVRVRVDPAELGWVMVRVAGTWHVADALRSVMSGVSLAEWRLTVRELRLDRRRRAALHEDQIARTLRKIEEINKAQIETMRVQVPYLTADDLKREERLLGLGLTPAPETTPDKDLPPAEDGLGRVVPIDKEQRDLFSISGEEEPETSADTDEPAGPEQPSEPETSVDPEEPADPEGDTPAPPPPARRNWGLEED